MPDLEGADDELWRRILGVNLMGPWYLSRAAVPALREAKGAIVNVGSIAGIIAGGSSLPYAVSKAALHHLTRTLAQALAPDVRVNAVAPGLVETPWTAGWEANEAIVAGPPLVARRPRWTSRTLSSHLLARRLRRGRSSLSTAG